MLTKYLNRHCCTKLTTRAMSTTPPPSDLKQTALFDFNQAQGAKFGPYAGYYHPVSYPHGLMKEHMAVREAAGVFDVSHMGQVRIHGKDRFDFLEYITVADRESIKPGTGALSLILNKNGGVIDDTIVTNMGDHIYMVVNGACKVGDLEHFRKV